MTDYCNGNNCPRKEDCQRYVDMLYLSDQKPFTSTLCGWSGQIYEDNFKPVKVVEMEAVNAQG